jgi:hypothetical protein
VVKHAVVSSEDTYATACSFHPSFRVGPYHCDNWGLSFSPEAEALFLLAKEVIRTSRTTNPEFAGNFIWLNLQ